MLCKQFNRPPIIPYFWHKNHYNWSELWRLGLLLQRSKKNPTDPGSPKLNMGAWKLNTMRFGGDETHPNTPIISWEYDDWRLGRVTVIASYLCIAVIYTQGLVGSSWTSGSLTILSSPNQQVSILPEKKRKLDIMNMVVLKSNILYLCGLVYLSTFIFLFENSHWKLILEVIIDSEMAQQRKLAECKMNKLVNLSKVFNFYRTLWGSFIYKKWQSIYYLVVEPTHLKNTSQIGNLPQFSRWKWKIFELPPPSLSFLGI